jgi:hypothetical protein
MLLRATTHLGFQGYKDPVTRTARTFKRLLTTGVTTSPDFMFRNFVRDAAHAWAINKDGFKFGKDSIAGFKNAVREDKDYQTLMFEMGSFQGGYVHGTDPEASAQIIRRTLQAKGLTGRAIDEHMDSIIDTPKKLWDVIEYGWQQYRGFGDKVENSNRLSTYKAALAAGKHPLQAAYEAKDQMDYSRRGNFAALMWLTDVVPFLNARMQGLDKLARSSKERGEFSKVFGMKLGKIAMFSVMLAMLNDDDEEYQALPDWEKDAYWHFWIADEHFRIPKPFEIGVIAGTIPERMYRAWVSESQPTDKLKWSLMHGVMETLNFNPIPQVIVPPLEIWGNKSFYFETPIETLREQRQLPADRYDSRTTEIAKALGRWLDMSPKRLEHLWRGYTGTMGAYALASADMVVRSMMDVPTKPAMRASDVVGIKSFYRGSGPPYNTQYETDLYDFLEEVNQIHASINSRMKEGRREDARELKTEERGKLKYRKALSRSSDKLSDIRARINKIQQRTDLSPQEKREKIDRMLRLKAKVAKRAAERSEAAF